MPWKEEEEEKEGEKEEEKEKEDVRVTKIHQEELRKHTRRLVKIDNKIQGNPQDCKYFRETLCVSVFSKTLNAFLPSFLWPMLMSSDIVSPETLRGDV